MNDDDKALCERLEQKPVASFVGSPWLLLTQYDEERRQAARRIRELSAEVESLAKQLREQAILELAQMGQECDRHD